MEFSLEVAALNQDLLAWEHTYNTIRPHLALAYLTPHQFVSGKTNKRRPVSLIYWTSTEIDYARKRELH